MESSRYIYNLVSFLSFHTPLCGNEYVRKMISFFSTFSEPDVETMKNRDLVVVHQYRNDETQLNELVPSHKFYKFHKTKFDNDLDIYSKKPFSVGIIERKRKIKVTIVCDGNKYKMTFPEL